jgi:hypothetical protein
MDGPFFRDEVSLRGAPASAEIEPGMDLNELGIALNPDPGESEEGA